MARIKSYLLSGGTLVCALGIGYFMQYGGAAPGASAAPGDTLDVSDVTLTSSAIAPRIAPVDRPGPETASLDGAAPADAATDNPPARDCDVALTALPTAAAMVTLTLDAPCMGGERLTLHHNGMMFTEVTEADGSLSLSVPALAPEATFVAAFANGSGAAVTAEVPSLDLYDRVVLQWRGTSGLQLHAREFTDAYFGEGHVWADAGGDLAAVARGESGFLIRLGHETSPSALMAEVYSFPAGTTERSGDVALTVEAEVTEANCNALVEAQTLERHGGADLRVRDLTLEIPACDATGDFLVLKNLVQDLTIAAN